MSWTNRWLGGKGLIGNLFISSRAGQVPVQIQLAPSQTANALEVKSSAGTTLFSVAADGDVTAAGLTPEAGSISSSELAENTIQYAEVPISKAEILTLNSVGKTLVDAPGAGKVLEFISLVLIYDFATAAYGDGGTVHVLNDAVVVSNVISEANSFGAAGDKIAYCVALDTANGILLTDNGALILKANTGDFTDPGTAAGVGRAKVAYRVHTHGL